MQEHHATPNVLGVATHYGRGECVVVGVRGAAPLVCERTRIALIEPGLPSAPYHHEALQMPLADAEALVREVRQSVSRCARQAVSDLLRRHTPVALVIEASPFPALPEALAAVLQSRQLTCAADGMLYREAVAAAAAAAGLEVVRTPRRTDPLAQLAALLRVPRPTIASLVVDLGKPFGTPWRKDHKEATAAALAVLCRYTAVRLG